MRAPITLIALAVLGGTSRAELAVIDHGVGHVVLSDGRIRSWGGPTATVREVGVVPGAVKMVVGVVITRDGSVIDTRWKDGRIDQTLPMRDVSPAAAVTVGRYSRKLFVGTDGKIRFVDNKSTADEARRVAGVSDAVEVVSNRCLRNQAGEVRCWETGKLDPLPLPPSKQIVEFKSTVCSLGREGGVACWQPKFSRKPTVIPGFESATQIVADTVFGLPPTTGLLCGLLERGAVACATLGHSEKAYDDGPIGRVTPVPGITGATALAVSERSACARSGNDVWCWGGNDRGQLGDGTRIDRTTPVKVAHVLADPLPAPRDGFDQVPESAIAMSWAGLPAACKQPKTLRHDVSKRAGDHDFAFEVRSAYAYKLPPDGKLAIRLASYRTGPEREPAFEPRGAQEYLLLVLARAARGTYAVEADGAKELVVRLSTPSGTQRTMQGSDEVTLSYLDARWACGTYRYQQWKTDKKIESPFAARIL
jgi:hypothetical protein